MSSQHAAIFLTAYFACALTILVVSLFVTRRSLRTWALVFVAIMGLAVSAVVGALLNEGQNYLGVAIQDLSKLSRVDVTALLLGLCAALPLAVCWSAGRGRPLYVFSTLLVVLGLLGTLLFGALVAGKDLISPYLPHPDSEFEQNTLGKLAADEYQIEDFANTELIPIRIAVSPGGKIYVSGHTGIAAQEGAIVQLLTEENGKVVEKGVAKMLNRPYGLLALDDRLLVSRSGQYTQWKNGVSSQVSTGAVTLLKDLDNDGVMDFYHDIVTDLPGAKGPDFLHQNNAIALDDAGALYITTANHSDGYPSVDETAGAILKADSEDYSDVRLYATGLRNPFGLTFDANGDLFATDNDSQTGVLGGDMGDKLLHIVDGAFYGHPFGAEDDPDVHPSALRSKYALGGLTLATAKNLPENYQNHLFVVVYGEGRIMKVVVEEDNGVKTATLEPFAVVPGAVDIAASPDGDFYVAVYPDKVVRLRLKNNGE